MPPNFLPKSRDGRRTTTTAAGALLIAASVWVVALLGGLAPLMRPLDAMATQMRAALLRARPQVLLVPELREGHATADEVVAAATHLRDLGAAHLRLSSWPEAWASETEARLREVFPDLVVGLRPRLDAVRPERLLAPGASTRFASTTAWSVGPALSGDRDGATQARSLEIDTRRLPTLARAHLEGEAKGGDARYGIVFRGRPGSLPLVSVERAARGDLVADLARDRHVLLDPSTPGLGETNPATGRGERMTLLEIQGNALDTVLAGRHRSRLPRWVDLLLLAAAAVGIGALALRIHLRLLAWLALTVAAAAVGLQLLLHVTTGWVVPGSETAVVGALVAAGAARQRLASTQESARSLLRDSMGRLQDRVWPSSFYLSDDPWPHLADLVDQTFDLRRLIFLEIVPGDHRVREIHAVGCAVSDIHERRRDYLRTPYSTAIRRKGPYRLDRAYLRDPADDEVQYLVPLVFGGDVLGFWAFGAYRETTETQDFDLLLHNFADQLGEILHHRNRMQRSVGSVQTGRGRSLWERQDETFRSLHWLSILLERRLARMESLLQGLGSAIVLYDLFGRPIDMTDRMAEVLRLRDIAAGDLNSAQLIGRLTDKPPDEVRALIRRALLGGESVTHAVETGDLRFNMILSPIRPSSISPLEHEGAGGIIGLALELQDTTAQEALAKVQSSLSERLGVRIRNDLSAVDFALQLLDDKVLGETYTDEMLAVASLKTQQMQRVLQECEGYLDIDLRTLREAHYPIDALPHLERAVLQKKPAAAERNVRLEFEAPARRSHVLASPLAFERGIHTMLDYLLEDARDDTDVTIRLQDHEAITQVSMETEGYGTPQRTLDAILAGDTTLERSTHRALAHLAEIVTPWGAQLSGTSQVGEGTELRMSLERLHHL